MLSDAEWERLENEHWEEAEEILQRRADRARVRGYFLAVAECVERAHTDAERAMTLLRNARSVLEKAEARLARELDFASTLADIVGRDDPDEYERLAIALEEAGF